MGEMVDDGSPRDAARESAEQRPTYLGPYGEPIAPWRQSLDSGASRAIDWSASFLVNHWLFLVNVCVGIFAFLPFIAPVLLAAGLTAPASVIYAVYGFTCHQRPDRSWFILGEKMAYCQRDAVIYPAMFFAGLAFARRRTIRPLRLRWYLVLIAPIAVDGLTQAFGLRESTPELRAITGAIFGVATVWLCYPYVQRLIDEGQ